MERFSDFATERPITGEKISMNELLDKEIEIIGYRVTESTKRVGTMCLMLHIRLGGKERVCFTGSSVLHEQIEKYSNHIPFITTIKRVDNFLTFS